MIELVCMSMCVYNMGCMFTHTNMCVCVSEYILKYIYFNSFIFCLLKKITVIFINSLKCRAVHRLDKDLFGITDTLYPGTGMIQFMIVGISNN